MSFIRTRTSNSNQMSQNQARQLKRSILANKHRGLELLADSRVQVSVVACQHSGSKPPLNNYQAIFGIRFQLTERQTDADADAADADADTEAADEEPAVKYELHLKKTRHAPNGRQQNRRSKTAELMNEIRKKKNNMAKILRTNAYLAAQLRKNAAAATTTDQPVVAKKTKQDMCKNSQRLNNMREYKAAAAAASDNQ